MKIRFLGLIIPLIISLTAPTYAYEKNGELDSAAVITNLFWDNWYGQFGADMNLFFPHGHNMKNVFPNGKSFGINAAFGKWFSPDFGGRIKVTWNNGIFKNDHNTWLRPYDNPGGNQRGGGFITFIGDIQFNLNNLLGDYSPNRNWNIIFAPRAGGWLDVGTGKGCPLVGVGIINTYLFGKNWSLFTDLGYHFVASINGVNSGNDHGSNGYAEISVGVQYDFIRKSKEGGWKRNDENDKREGGIKLNSFWDNWFIQTGLGMSLINPYGTNFSNVFPNGKTFGINFGVGKWFTPESGIRGSINWQNGILSNKHAQYLDSKDGQKLNYKEHGFLSLYADMLLSLHNMINGYNVERTWNAILYPRMGIVYNFSSDNEESPLLGLGIENTIKLNRQTKLYADVSYHVVTSGFLDGKYYTGDGNGLSSNGWFDFNVGIQYDFGRNWWDRSGKSTSHGSRPRFHDGHNWPRFIVNTGASVVVAFGAKTVLKAMVKEERPDHSDNKSFPSGHAAIAFAAARSIDKEFKNESILIPIVVYSAATAVGIERVTSDRHHWYDVAAGAALGFGSAELTWWLSDIIFKKANEKYSVGFSGNTVDVTVDF